MEFTQNYLMQLELNHLDELAKFVVEENFSHHSDNCSSIVINDEINEIFNEELEYFNDSKIIVAKDRSGTIQGSIRVINWDYKSKLPLEKLFQINLFSKLRINKKTPVWHIGRFATKKNCTDKYLFKKLMVSAIEPICENKNGYAIAECDKKLLRAMNLLGITTHILGNSIHYLGSETIPIAMDYEGLKNFYNCNKHLNANYTQA